jgi:3-methyladenine DNA glycosylase AlkD
MAPESKSISSTAEEISTRLFSLANSNTEAIRTIRREYSKQLAKSPARFVVKVALQLLRNNTIAHRFVSYELVNKHPAALGSVSEKDIKQFGRGINSWGSVDMFGCYLAGPAWREHQLSERLIHSWARSKDRWWRRAALVSTVPLNNKARGGTGDTRRTLEVCDLLIDDRDDMVVKAVSWALRELAKRDPDAVREFLNRNRGHLAARVIREVDNKLLTGLKNPRPAKASTRH